MFRYLYQKTRQKLNKENYFFPLQKGFGFTTITLDQDLFATIWAKPKIKAHSQTDPNP